MATVLVQGLAATVYALAVEPRCPTREVRRAMTLVVQSAVRRWQENKIIYQLPAARMEQVKPWQLPALPCQWESRCRFWTAMWGIHTHHNRRYSSNGGFAGTH